MKAILTLTSKSRSLGEAVMKFFTEPASPRPLAVFRIGVAAVLLIQAFTFLGSLLELYGNQGLVQWTIADRLIQPGVPRISWLANLVAPLGIDADASVRLVFLMYVGSLACLLIGWRTRGSAVGAWLTQLAMISSGHASTYGVDQFGHIALFYCMWLPVGHDLSADKVNGLVSGLPSASARLGLRLLQLHLCVVYLASGIEKASGIQWRDGEAIWRALMRPDLGQFDVTWLASVPLLAKLACWGTLAVEIGYSFLVWPRYTRKLMAWSTIGLHVGIAGSMGLVSFSAIMVALTFAAFAISATPAYARIETAPATAPDLAVAAA